MPAVHQTTIHLRREITKPCKWCSMYRSHVAACSRSGSLLTDTVTAQCTTGMRTRCFWSPSAVCIAINRHSHGLASGGARPCRLLVFVQDGSRKPSPQMASFSTAQLSNNPSEVKVPVSIMVSHAEPGLQHDHHGVSAGVARKNLLSLRERHLRAVLGSSADCTGHQKHLFATYRLCLSALKACCPGPLPAVRD